MEYLLTHSIKNAADSRPDHTAFRHNSNSLDYQTFCQQTARIAYCLRGVGIRKGDRVGIMMYRCLESALSIYGIFQAGAAYVPIDPYAPTDRIAAMVQNCSIKVIITTPKLAKKIDELSQIVAIEHVLGLNDNLATFSWDEMLNAIELQEDIKILADDLAYIIYTSGTTGTPKGIMHSHYSGLNYARLSADLYSVGHNDVIANHCALHYDISTFGYFTGPLAGATTEILSDAHTMLPASMTQLVQDQEVTIWYSVPLAIIQMVRSGCLESRNFEKLRWVLFGGESMSIQHLKNFARHCPNASFSNVYGPAEVNQCTYFNMSASEIPDIEIPLGRIWDNTDYLILSDDWNNKGELAVRSATMMLGYWGNPNLTESKMHTVTLPAGTRKYYKTGDLVSEDDNGILHFHGRIDRQTKIRGQRIELEEVELAIQQHPDVDECAVMIIQESEENILLAAIIPKEKNMEVGELTSFLKKKLPLHGIPKSLVNVTDLPRTAAGKLDYEKLSKVLFA